MRRLMPPLPGFIYICWYIPEVTPLRGSTAGLLYIAPQPGLTIPQPFGLPNSFTTAVPAVISLSTQWIISLMATAMNFAARQGNFAIEYQQ